MGSYSNRTTRSGRFDVKSLAQPGDLESILGLEICSFRHIRVDVSVVSLIGIRGRQIDMSTMRSRGPRIAIIRRPIGIFLMAVAHTRLTGDESCGMPRD